MLLASLKCRHRLAKRTPPSTRRVCTACKFHTDSLASSFSSSCLRSSQECLQTICYPDTSAGPPNTSRCRLTDLKCHLHTCQLDT
jgi:hypothetical protein